MGEARRLSGISFQTGRWPKKRLTRVTLVQHFRSPCGLLKCCTAREVWRAAQGPPRGYSGKTRREGASWSAIGAKPLWKYSLLQVHSDLRKAVLSHQYMVFDAWPP
jgi:hypothetical protein